MLTGSLTIAAAQVWDGDGFAARDVHVVDGRVAEPCAPDARLDGVRLQVEASGAVATLRSMTAVNAELIGDESLGHLRPGAYGDAVLLASDPLAVPSALWEQNARIAVVRAGVVV